MEYDQVAELRLYETAVVRTRRNMGKVSDQTGMWPFVTWDDNATNRLGIHPIDER